MKEKTRCLLVSDFNIEAFKSHIDFDGGAPDVEAILGPYGQVMPVLAGATEEPGQSGPDCAVIWTRPEGVVPSFGAVLNYEPVAVGALLDEVDRFARQVLDFQRRVPNLFVPTWVLPAHAQAYGMLAMKDGLGVTNALMRMNLRLSECFAGSPNIHLLDAQRWLGEAGGQAFSPKLWYMCKVPFGKEVFRAAARDIKSALRGSRGEAKKLIVVDLDNTLWGGIVGEVGWQGLNLGGHNALGEAHADFQRALKAMTRRGVILGIASKNTESIALEAFEKHPEMVLNLDDFAGWRINWQDKAQNIADLVSELGLGLQSTVFIDDSAAERARVRDALPEVAVPEWPKNAMFYQDALLKLPYFDSPAISREDQARAGMYVAERKRKALRGGPGSLDDWLKTLDTTITVEELNEANLQRAAQLLNKTNQMNLSTRRLTESELLAWAGQGGRKLWTFRVADKFGDMGLCGLVSLEQAGKTARIVDFVLSCRVIGRKVEDTMLHTAISHARSNRAGEVRADFVRTAKNEPCLIFLKQSGLSHDEDTDRFSWQTKRGYDRPEAVTIEGL